MTRPEVVTWDVWTVGAVLLAYLVGSIPFSYLIARASGVADVRTVGSGNVGAANVMRSAGKGAGLVAFVLDFLKGVAGALVGVHLDHGGGLLPALTASAAVVGHVYPVWLGFRGGKGVATGAGAFLPLAPVATASGLLAFALLLAVTRYVSLSSIGGGLTLAVVAAFLRVPVEIKIAAAVLTLLIVFRHRDNLKRIANGTERQMGSSRS